jgi:hypothetical protein
VVHVLRLARHLQQLPNPRLPRKSARLVFELLPNENDFVLAHVCMDQMVWTFLATLRIYFGPFLVVGKQTDDDWDSDGDDEPKVKKTKAKAKAEPVDEDFDDGAASTVLDDLRQMWLKGQVDKDAGLFSFKLTS